jgi:WD40-like Beta Propeller Repeat
VPPAERRRSECNSGAEAGAAGSDGVRNSRGAGTCDDSGTPSGFKCEVVPPGGQESTKTGWTEPGWRARLEVYEFATQAISALTDHGCGPQEERRPRFSPDDRLLAFWRSNAAADPANDPNAGSAIFVRNLSTGKETRVIDWATDATHLDWSPDGRWIVFVPRVWTTARLAPISGASIPMAVAWSAW